VLPPGKFYGMIPEPLLHYSESFMTTAATVSRNNKHDYKVTKVQTSLQTSATKNNTSPAVYNVYQKLA